PVPSGNGSIFGYNEQDANLVSLLRATWTPTSYVNKSYEGYTYIGAFTGTMPSGTLSMEGVTTTGETYGAITTPGTTNLLGGESLATILSTGGTLANVIGWGAGVVDTGTTTTNATNIMSFQGRAPTKAGTGTFTNAYGGQFVQGTAGSTRN